MGCLCCKSSKEAEEVTEVARPKEYSWKVEDHRGKADPKDFMIDGLKDQDVCHLAGAVSGQHFVIQNCSNSSIFLLDHFDSINIDDCVNCKIVLGPVKGSAFIRDCSKCVIVVPCGQFRLRDCHHLDVFLHCVTQPIIEASSHIQFACIRMHYNQIRDHMKSACLSVYNNLWYSIHDFTPTDGCCNWKKLPPNTRLQDYITPPFPPELRSAGWSVTNDYSLIPLSHGMPENCDSELCLVLTFIGCQYQQEECADAFLQALLNENGQSVLLTSRELLLQPSDAVAMQLNSDVLERHFKDGPVVGLIIGGPNCFHTCFSVLKNLNLREQTYISPDSASATKHAISFLQCALMHLGC